MFLLVQPELKAKLEDSRYNIAMENHEFGVPPEAFIKWPVLNDTYDILSTSKDRYVCSFVSQNVLICCSQWACMISQIAHQCLVRLDAHLVDDDVLAYDSKPMNT